MTVGRACEAVLCVADKRTGDDTTHTVLADQKISCNTAVFIQLFGRNNILMRRDLENRVCGGIDDQIAGLHMFLAVFVNYRRAGPRSIGQNASAGCFAEGLKHFFGEAVGISRQRIRRNQTCNLPVTDGGILAHGGFLQAANGAFGCVRSGQIIDGIDVAETIGKKIRYVQLVGGGAAFQRVDIDIAKACRVRHLTAAAGIEYK